MQKPFLNPSIKFSVSEDNGIALLTAEDKQVFSVGISTGGSAEIRMASIDPNRHIIATTIDTAGTKFAEKQIAAEGFSKQITVKIEDVTDPLPYADEYFDFIYARLVLHYLPKLELVRTLQELNRVLKAGGKLFVVVRSTNCAEALDKNTTRDPETCMTTYFSNEKPYSRYFHTEDSIRDYLINSGFSIKHVKTYQEHLCIDFERKVLSNQVDSLIEVLAIRS